MLLACVPCARYVPEPVLVRRVKELDEEAPAGLVELVDPRLRKRSRLGEGEGGASGAESRKNAVRRERVRSPGLRLFARP